MKGQRSGHVLRGCSYSFIINPNINNIIQNKITTITFTHTINHIITYHQTASTMKAEDFFLSQQLKILFNNTNINHYSIISNQTQTSSIQVNHKIWLCRLFFTCWSESAIATTKEATRSKSTILICLNIMNFPSTLIM
jgi:hypothetical protein